MDIRLKNLIDFFVHNKKTILVQLKELKGSTPRDKDAQMLVGNNDIIGTIGGGKLEFLAINKAKNMLLNREKLAKEQFILNDENSQCCGGVVLVEFSLLHEKQKDNLIKKIKLEEDNLPHIYLFGAGHIGKMLAKLLSPMPFKVNLVDNRPEQLEKIEENINIIPTPLPEKIVRQAPKNSAFSIFTHDHSLDFLIAFEALQRKDALYIGMIGSKTKRKKFENYFLKMGGNKQNLAKLSCPIAAEQVGDKRVHIIAALTLGEIISKL